MNIKMLYLKEIIRKMFSKEENLEKSINLIIFNKTLDICF